MPKTKKIADHNPMVASRINGGLQIKGHLSIERDDLTSLSWGRIVLLGRIDEHGLVSAAAKSMQMSFSHAGSPPTRCSMRTP